MGPFKFLQYSFYIAFSGKIFIIEDTLQEPQANNLVNVIPLLGVEFSSKMSILCIVLRAVLRYQHY